MKSLIQRIPSITRKIVIGVLIALMVALISLPILAEYVLEKNDIEWIGREVEVEDIDLNIFTGRAAAYNGFILENDGSTTFINFEELEVNFSVWSLLFPPLEIEYIYLRSPHVRLVQEGYAFNFDDLIESSEDADTTTVHEDEAFKILLRDIRIMNGTLTYTDQNLGSELTVDRIQIEVPELGEGVDVIDAVINGDQLQGGVLTALIKIENASQKYTIDLDLQDWQMRPYRNYLNSYLAIQDFAGLFNVEMRIGGVLGEDDLSSHAYANIKDFLLVDNNSDSLITWSNFEVYVDSVNTAEDIYDLGVVKLDRPHVLFRYFEESDNFSRLLLDTTSIQTLDTVSVAKREIIFQNPFQYIAEYLNYLVTEDVLTTYASDSMKVSDGIIIIHDYSHLEEATITIDNLDLLLPEVRTQDSTVEMLISGTVNETGALKSHLVLFRSGLSNMDLDLELRDFYLSVADPYSKFYTAFPVISGKMKLENHTSIRDNQLDSDFILIIDNAELGKKLDLDAEYNIPMRLALGLLKDVNGQVKVELPIEGDLSDPEYKYGKVIMRVLVNLLAKAVASPFNLLARAFDADEDDLKAIRFENDQDTLAVQQIRSLDLTARVLERKKDLIVHLQHVFDTEDEKRAIALKKAAQKFIAEQIDSLNANDWMQINESDSLFITFLNSKVGGLGQRSVREMCVELIGDEELTQRVVEIKEKQQQLVSDYLYQAKGLPPERAIIETDVPDSLKQKYNAPAFVVIYDIGDPAYASPDSLATKVDDSPDSPD